MLTKGKTERDSLEIASIEILVPQDLSYVKLTFRQILPIFMISQKAFIAQTTGVPELTLSSCSR